MKLISRIIGLLLTVLFCISLNAQQIINAEYFFDSDPGIGNGTTLSVGSAGDTVEVNSNISTSGLTAGYHELFIRVKSDSGRWSLYEARNFYIQDTTRDYESLNIVQAEYFFDSDPGVGNGITIATGSPLDTIEKFTTISTNGLSSGFHGLFIRVKNFKGLWSLYEARNFYIQDTTRDYESLNIVQAEYFFDSDPGVGNGIALSSGAILDTVDHISSISIVGLSGGFHNLFIRVKNVKGLWSLYEGRNFYIDADTLKPEHLKIVRGEYFIDSDPGVGNGININIGSPADSVDISITVSATGLSPGWHNLFIRVINNLGLWSLFEVRPFFICDTLPVVNLGKDTSVCSASLTLNAGNPGSTYLWNNNTTAQTLTVTTSGTYYVTVTNGCSASDTIQVVLNPRPSVNFTINDTSQCLTSNNFSFTNTSSVSNGSITYLWNFGDGTTTTSTSPTKAYTNSGTYSVKLIATTNNGCVDSVAKVINVNPKPTVSFSINNSNQCVNGNSYQFTNTSAVSTGTMAYQWAFGDGGTSTSTSPTKTYAASGTYNVKLVASSSSGCKDSTTQTMVVYPKPSSSFVINNTGQCVNGNNFIFTNTSSLSSGTMTYFWSFGDGNISTSTSPNNTYSTAGVYSIKLIVTSNNGCKDSTTQNVFVTPKPSTSFTVNNASQCFNSHSFTFTNTSSISSGTMTYLWSFGDGNTSASTNPVKTYVTAGTFTVKLVATSNNGCKDSTTQNVTVFPKPNVSFTVNNSGQCLSGNNFSFTNSSSISSGTVTYTWYFGDGNTSSLNSPSKTYSVAGTYAVKLVATSDNGCKDSTTQNVVVSPKPSTTFTVNNASQCFNSHSFTFTNTSSISSGTMTYLWSFGDGNTSASTSPVKTYLTAGTFTVKLVATSNNGCKDSTTQNVTVYPKPTVSFTVNNSGQCLSGNNFSFTNSSSISSGTVTYTWYFGDGNTSSLNSPSNTYAVAGTYAVKLVATSDNGCKDSVSQSVTVYPKPTPSFTINSVNQCFNSHSFTFTNTSSISSGTMTYLWSFGDGNTSASTSPVKTYLTAGTFTVKLVATSNNGCKDSTTQNVTVYPKPTVSFTVNNSGQCLSGNNFSFTNSSSISSGTVTYTWYFGDGNTSSLNSPSNTYAVAGTYAVKLVATSDNGCKDSVSQSVTVYPKPIPSFTINTVNQCFNNNSFTFTNTSSISSGTITYLWSFGDGNTSVSSSPVKTYLTAGTFTVKLVATSNNGCKDSTTQNVTVFPKPNVSFTVNNSGHCLNGNSFNFINTSSISNGSLFYFWSFGNGDTSTSTNPTKTYLSSGTFTIKLIAISNNGCKDSVMQTVSVYPKPLASFNINSNNQCLNGNNFVFTNTSSITAGTMSYQWLFGDATSSSAVSPAKTYLTNGTYTVKLIVTSDSGCVDSAVNIVTVFTAPTPSFTVNSGNQCLDGNNFVFTNTSTIGAGTMSYQWYFGDGTGSTSTNPVKSYVSSGTYKVNLIVTSNIGCIDSAAQVIVVYPKPSASFSINNSGICLNDSFRFTNTSTITSGTISYQWLFGDGSFYTGANPVKVYPSSGSYTVKLIVTSNNGCIDSTQQTVDVFPKPLASFLVNDSAQCLSNNNFIFNNTSAASGGTIAYRWGFGDGTFATNNSPVKVYSNAGLYPVTLVCTSNNGCIDSVVRWVTVYPQPKASFTVNDSDQCLYQNGFSFTNTSFLSSGIMSYYWTFGDGSSSTSANPSKTYAAVGTYLVKLVATSDNGCSDSTTRIISVFAKPNVAIGVLPASNQVCVNEKFSFNSNSTIAGSGILTDFSWDFGDGTFSNLANPPLKYYSQSGAFTVKLIVTNSNGCIDSTQVVVTVLPTPVVGFTSTPACYKDSTYFTDASTSGTSYSWNFGDPITGTANNSSLVNPSHLYSKPGNFKVILVVSNASGCVDSVSNIITVWPLPTASFKVTPKFIKLSKGVATFTDKSQMADSLFIDFGDGQSQNQNPQSSWTHTYSDTGKYIVKLIAKSKNNCNSIAFDTIVIEDDFEIFMPNAFSPNGDGINDILAPEGTFVSEYSLTIYNRWGEMLFQTSEEECRLYNKCGWDGKYKNEPAQEDIYIYQMVIYDKNNRRHFAKGTFIISR